MAAAVNARQVFPHDDFIDDEQFDDEEAADDDVAIDDNADWEMEYGARLLSATVLTCRQASTMAPRARTITSSWMPTTPMAPTRCSLPHPSSPSQGWAGCTEEVQEEQEKEGDRARRRGCRSEERRGAGRAGRI